MSVLLAEMHTSTHKTHTLQYRLFTLRDLASRAKQYNLHRTEDMTVDNNQLRCITKLKTAINIAGMLVLLLGVHSTMDHSSDWLGKAVQVSCQRHALHVGRPWSAVGCIFQRMHVSGNLGCRSKTDCAPVGGRRWEDGVSAFRLGAGRRSLLGGHCTQTWRWWAVVAARSHCTLGWRC